MELDALGKFADEFKRLGAPLVAITPQRAEFSRAMMEEKGLSFEILSDPGNRVAESYGIKYALPDYLIELYESRGLDVPKHNGDHSWTVPMPTRLIVDTDGIIRYADIHADYTKRPNPEDTIDALKSLAGVTSPA